MNSFSQQHFYRNPLTVLENVFSCSINAIEWQHWSHFFSINNINFVFNCSNFNHAFFECAAQVGLNEKLDNNVASSIFQLHARLGFNLSTTVKRKLSLGATILQNGGLEKVFKRNFQIRQGERLVTASQCYISTTAGPMAGFLFISSEKIAFLSERSIKLCSQNGQFARTHYKVTIPLSKISEAIQNKDITRTKEKYIEIVTVDNFDFWFLGFSNYQRTYKNLQREISQSKITEYCNLM